MAGADAGLTVEFPPVNTAPSLVCAATRPPKGGRLWSLRPGGPWDAGLLEAFDRVIALALAQVERAAKDPEKAIHEYRKSIRRARAVVRLVRGPLATQFAGLDGTLREAVLATSGLRDVDVLRGLVAGLLEPPPPPGPCAVVVAGEAAAQGTDVATATATVVVAPRPTLDAAARPALERLDALLAERQAAQQGGSVQDALRRGAELVLPLLARFARVLPSLLAADLREGFAGSYRRARRAREEAARTRDDDAVHAWRKRVKELRYQLELDPTADEAPERACWADLAERLGAITDQVVLWKTATELLLADDPIAVEALLDGLRWTIEHDLEEAFAASELQFARKPRLFAATLLNG